MDKVRQWGRMVDWVHLIRTSVVRVRSSRNARPAAFILGWLNGVLLLKPGRYSQRDDARRLTTTIESRRWKLDCLDLSTCPRHYTGLGENICWQKILLLPVPPTIISRSTSSPRDKSATDYRFAAPDNNWKESTQAMERKNINKQKITCTTHEMSLSSYQRKADEKISPRESCDDGTESCTSSVAQDMVTTFSSQSSIYLSHNNNGRRDDDDVCA